MYGNKPVNWSDDLEGPKRLRCITNVFTRMRYFDADHNLDFVANGSPRQGGRRGLVPGFQIRARLRPDVRVFFGHWSTLPVGSYGRCFALDGGCVWGGHLVALRLDSEPEEWFFVDSTTRKPVKLQSG